MGTVVDADQCLAKYGREVSSAECDARNSVSIIDPPDKPVKYAVFPLDCSKCVSKLLRRLGPT